MKESPHQSSLESKKKLLWEYKEMFWSQHTFIMRDGSFEKKFMSNELNQELANEVNDEIIRCYFKELTNDFLDPLQRCFDKIWTGMKSFIIRSEHGKLFKQEKFYNFLKSYGFKGSFFILIFFRIYF
jgi:hypothetical protein